ncbi:helix-turn-helix transcriptional regulator [Dietzia sp. CQ4]|uniref:helix-turn-helix domain-containing protein n=1 Tax=Dietzia sp. (strain CQ4) TaxID=370437 RepID=UPI0015FB3343|nr:helix-turn-helix transcriptional regulator [Dietzia sp. CQ4]MBB1033438.1 helix-turn-helix transcriptional regulator [Dietzia sp. CQ4]
MTPDEARSLGRAIRTARLERGIPQLKLAVAIGVGGGQLGLWERGRVPAARGEDAYALTIPRHQLEAIAAALDCSVAAIADRAALSATTRVLYGLEPLGPARTLVAGQEYDLTDAEADRVADFIAGLITARELY